LVEGSIPKPRIQETKVTIFSTSKKGEKQSGRVFVDHQEGKHNSGHIEERSQNWRGHPRREE